MCDTKYFIFIELISFYFLSILCVLFLLLPIWLANVFFLILTRIPIHNEKCSFVGAVAPRINRLRCRFVAEWPERTDIRIVCETQCRRTLSRFVLVGVFCLIAVRCRCCRRPRMCAANGLTTWLIFSVSVSGFCCC